MLSNILKNINKNAPGDIRITIILLISIDFFIYLSFLKCNSLTDFYYSKIKLPYNS